MAPIQDRNCRHMPAFETDLIVTVTPNPAVDVTVFVPALHPGEVNTAAEARESAGGKGINVASCLADFGRRVAATGFLGKANEAIFARHLQSKGIADRFLRLEGATRTGIKVVDTTTNTTTDINLPGLGPDPRHVDALFDTVDGLVRPGRWFVLAGSLPPGLSDGFYRELAARILHADGHVALDTSGNALREGLRAGVTLAKPNLRELEWLCGTNLTEPDRILAAGEELLASGIRTVVISMGAEGALFLEDTQRLLVHPPATRVQSTVGAGDAMMAGMIAGACDGLDLAARARRATAFSLDTLTRIGAHLDPARVQKIEAQLTIDNPDGAAESAAPG